jgi:proteasome accessory factor C
MQETSTILNLITFLATNQGVTVERAAQAFGCSESALLKLLDELMMVGVPPYFPNDYISCTISASPERAIFLNFGDHFSGPLNLTPPEVMALKGAVELASRRADKPTTEALTRIRTTLDEALQGRAASLQARKANAFVTPRQTERMADLTGELSRAAEERRIAEIEYFSSHRQNLDTRRVQVFSLIEAGAHLYAWGYCELAGATRHFRVDRIRSVRVLDEKGKARVPKKRNAGRMKSIFEGRAREKMVISFAKELAEEIDDEWRDHKDSKLKHQSNGRVELTTPLYNQFWAIGYVMRFGGNAKLLAPRWLKPQLKRTIEETLKAHGS